MSASYFYLTLDTRAPGNPHLTINGGAARTGQRDVLVSISTADYEGGSRDVTLMRLWGDVDPAADPLVQPLEADSAWITYAPETAVRLSNGGGPKNLYARLRDDVCNETVPFANSITLDLATPQVTIITAIDRARISKTAPCDTASFEWVADRAFTSYQVRVVPFPGASQAAGVPLGTLYGSANVAGVGDWTANVPITTVVSGADLEVASPGNTEKVVKVFVRDANGVWSA